MIPTQTPKDSLSDNKMTVLIYDTSKGELSIVAVLASDKDSPRQIVNVRMWIGDQKPISFMNAYTLKRDKRQFKLIGTANEMPKPEIVLASRKTLIRFIALAVAAEALRDE